MTKPFDVFLSHNSTDKTWVIRLKRALADHKVRAWVDCDEILPGEIFVAALERGLSESKAVALVVSPEAMKSGWVNEEYARAMSMSASTNESMLLIPIILRQVDSLPGFLASRNWIDFRDEAKFEDNVKQLIRGLTGHMRIWSEVGTDQQDVDKRSPILPALQDSPTARAGEKQREQPPAPDNIRHQTLNRGITIHGNATGAFISGDQNNASVTMTHTTLQDRESVNIRSEFNALREVLKALETPMKAKLDRALEDINDELCAQDLDRDEIGKALERVLNTASKAAGFTQALGSLHAPVSKIVAWLGERWHGLLTIIGLTV